MELGLTTRRVRLAPQALLAMLTVLTLSGCATVPAQAPTPAATPARLSPQRLRIKNAGARAITGLVVGFAIDRVDFGDIAPGSTTAYKPVPNGVLHYAAYNFQMDGHDTGQAVIDFVGEQPLPGNDFTYVVDFDPSRFSQNEAIKLLGVTTEQ